MKKQPEKPVTTISKKDIRAAIAEQLQSAIPALKAQIGKKKYQDRIKKAAKLLMDGIKIMAPKPVAGIEKPSKRTTTKSKLAVAN